LGAALFENEGTAETTLTWVSDFIHPLAELRKASPEGIEEVWEDEQAKIETVDAMRAGADLDRRLYRGG
jgi:hypothetical protein